MARKTICKNISYDEQRKLYYVTLYYGKLDDGKISKTQVTAKSKSEAKRLLKEFEKNKAAGRATPPTSDTLAEYMKSYIDYKALTLAPTTIYGYTNIWKNHIVPYFKDKKLQSITTKDIQDYVSEKAKLVSTKTTKKHVDLMYSVFKNACATRIITENPIEHMERFKVPKNQHQCMNSAEIAQLCSSVKDTILELPVMLAAYMGLRRGEVLGLKWSHIDFDNKVLSIENTRTKAGSTLVEKAPKTEHSVRQLHLSDDIINALIQQKIRQQERNAQNKFYVESDYVVTMPNGKPFSPNYLSDRFHAHLIKHGLKVIRFHDLRHSFASIANDAGMLMNDISTAMGHSNIGVTSSIYTHEFSTKKTKAINAVAESIKAAQNTVIP